MHHRQFVSTTLLLIALVDLSGCEWPYFRKDVPVGERPYACVVGDFNGDALPDLGIFTWEGLAVLLNEGEGNFGRPVPNATIRDPVIAGDFDGDGRDDLADGDGVMLSRGDGAFLAALPLAGPKLAAGDFNRDQKLDLVLGTAEGIGVWLGYGDGTFGPGVTMTTGPVRQAVVADFNGDGRNDVAILPMSAPLDPVQILLGGDDGTLRPDMTTTIDAFVLLAADFNGDGSLDLATSGCAFCAEGTTGIALGQRDGNFQPLVPYPWGADTYPLAGADFTGDGKADLVVGGGNTDSISIYDSHGDGTFGFWNAYPVGWKPRAAVGLDLDDDGKRDLVTVNFGANSISVLLDRTEEDLLFTRAVSAASGAAIVAPESLATLFAEAPINISASANPPWPTSLGGISLEVRDAAGTTRLAPLLYVSPTQINFQVPAGTALGEAMLSIAGNPVAGMHVEGVAPALFMASPENETPAATGVVVETGGRQDPLEVFTCSDTFCQAEPIPLSSAGDRSIYLSFFGTGFRGATPDNVTCSISNVRLPVLYAGPQGTPGLDQINVRLLPETLLESEEGSYGPGPVTATMRINGVVANSTVINIR